MKPDYRIIVDGADVTHRFNSRLVRLVLRDKRGFEADQVDLEIADTDGKIELPRLGSTLQVKLGWEGESLVDKGRYKIDELMHNGPPDTLSIRGRSADVTAGLVEQKTRSWHETTLGDLITTIAKGHNLSPAISDTLATRTISHMDQTDESDAHLVTRLGIDHDAIATVKNGHLLFIRKGESMTAGGITLPRITVDRTDGDSHQYSQMERMSKYTGVRARWLDTHAAKAFDVLIGESGRIKSIRKTYQTINDATHAAESEWRRINRGGVSMQLTLAMARTDLIPETPVSLTGWKSAITNQEWVAGEVTHTLNESGLSTLFTLEIVKK